MTILTSPGACFSSHGCSHGPEITQNRNDSLLVELERRQGDEYLVGRALRFLSDVNRHLGLHEEGILQGKEALEIYERVGGTREQMQCLIYLAWLLFEDRQFDAAEEAASRALGLVPEKGEEFLVCQFHRVLGRIYQSRGEKKTAIHHFETALGIASPFDWHDPLFWIHHDMADLFSDQGEFNDAHAHVERAKSHILNDAYKLGWAVYLQAGVLHRQQRLEDAKLEASNALEIFEKLGAVKEAGFCRDLLQVVKGQ